MFSCVCVLCVCLYLSVIYRMCFSKSRKRRKVQLRMTQQRRSYQHQDQMTVMMKIPRYRPTVSTTSFFLLHINVHCSNKVFIINMAFYVHLWENKVYLLTYLLLENQMLWLNVTYSQPFFLNKWAVVFLCMCLQRRRAGVEGLIEIENPNRVAQKSKKVTQLELDEPKQLSRRERWVISVSHNRPHARIFSYSYCEIPWLSLEDGSYKSDSPNSFNCTSLFVNCLLQTDE